MKKVIEGEYRNDSFLYLKDIVWNFTEKIDGTNIRVYWDGHKVSFLGRTVKSEIPQKLMDRLNALFGGEETEELFEQKFGEMPVMLIDEGYGTGIQIGVSYRSDIDFILFGDLIVLTGTLDEGIAFVKTKPKSTIGTAMMEGIVGRPKVELRDRCGHRIIVKIKVYDFEEWN